MAATSPPARRGRTASVSGTVLLVGVSLAIRCAWQLLPVGRAVQLEATVVAVTMAAVLAATAAWAALTARRTDSAAHSPSLI